MNTITDLFQQAQLAEAAYANFIDPQTGLAYTDITKITGALQDQGNNMTFSDAQATAFVAQWKVVDQYSADGIIFGDNSGFSATLFEKLDANGNGTGQYTFAVRGSTLTNLGTDFIWADASLATGGIAIDQLVSMVNYVLRLDAGASGQTAQLVVDTPPGWPLPGSGDRTVVWSSPVGRISVAIRRRVSEAIRRMKSETTRHMEIVPNGI